VQKYSGKSGKAACRHHWSGSMNGLRNGLKQRIPAGMLVLAAILWSVAAAAQTVPNGGKLSSMAGQVNAVTGQVAVRDREGRQVPLKVGELFAPGSSISTGADAEVRLLFADGQIVTLGPNSILRVEEFRFDPGNAAAGRCSMELVSGMMQYVSGAIHAGNPSGIRITAGDSTHRVTIHSKDVAAFVLEVDRNNREAGSAAVAVGEVSVTTDLGTARLRPDQFYRWDDTTAGSSTLPLVAAPAITQAAVAALRPAASVGGLPLDVEFVTGMMALAQEQGLLIGKGEVEVTGDVTGRVRSVVGTVLVRDSNGREAPLRTGDVVGRGSAVITGNNGQVGLLFSDGQAAALNRNSILRFDNFEFDVGEIKAAKASLGLVSGTMHLVAVPGSGGIADNYRIIAGNAIVDVLSKNVTTAFVVTVDGKSQDVGSAAVASGEILIRTPDGSPTRVSSDTFSRWQPGATASPAQPVTDAPGAMQAAVAVTQTAASVTVASMAAEGTATTVATTTTPGAAPDTAQVSLPAAPNVGDALDLLPPTAAGEDGRAVLLAAVLASVTPGAAGGCVGSPC